MGANFFWGKIEKKSRMNTTREILQTNVLFFFLENRIFLKFSVYSNSHYNGKEKYKISQWKSPRAKKCFRQTISYTVSITLYLYILQEVQERIILYFYIYITGICVPNTYITYLRRTVQQKTSVMPLQEKRSKVTKIDKD